MTGTPDTARPPRRRTTVAAGLVAMATVGALGAAVFLHDPILHATGLRGDVLPAAASTLFPPPPTPSDGPTGEGTITAPTGAQPDSTLVPASLASRINAVPQQFNGASAALVLDTQQGGVLYARNPAAMMIPASNLKTLTMLAALSAIPGETRVSTTVTSPQPGVLVLRGGGDPYLRSTPAGSDVPWATTLELARRTAAALKAAGTTSVTVGYDQTLFAGPDWAPTWPAGYVDQVTRISALTVDGGMTRGADGRITSTVRTRTPALTAATVFANQLKAEGITVTGQVGSRPSGGAALAAVESLPLEQVAALAMVASDNTATEVMLRHLALARGKPGSFAGGVEALQQVLTELKVWRTGASVHDGSGLSRSNLVNAEMLGSAWRTIATTERLRTLVTATPVAGVSGTLRDRFLVEAAAPGRGRVHAKTGTLSEVSSLSGWTVTDSGQGVIIVLLVNQSRNDWFARAWIDTVAAVVTDCGCP